MKRRHWVWVFLCFALLVSLQIIMLHETGYSRKPEPGFDLPDTGIWYCQELDIILLLEDGTAICRIDGTEYRGYVAHEHGSRYIAIGYYGSDDRVYQTKLTGVIVNIQENVILIQDQRSGHVYEFAMPDE